MHARGGCSARGEGPGPEAAAFVSQRARGGGETLLSAARERGRAHGGGRKNALALRQDRRLQNRRVDAQTSAARFVAMEEGDARA
eukprot:3957739-Pyramimonas_sp.AAC.1